jgi:hypothetical protein
VGELIQFKGLDADFSIEIGRDIASQGAKEILRAALQDTNMAWEVEAYLRSLNEKDPYLITELGGMQRRPYWSCLD